MELEPNLPWVEKYRPSKLGQLISHADIISTIDRFIKEDRLPHLLLFGPPGTGKTSTILASAKQMFSPHEFRAMVLELNASDDRGISVVREQILSFASTRSHIKGLKLIILDEADAMTNDAQNALRRIIEKYTENVRFCLICNYISKIIPALQSRCTRFRFAPLRNEQMLPRIREVIAAEKLNINDDGLTAVVDLAQGDMRKALNILQSSSMSCSDNAITEECVYLCVGHPLKKDILSIVDWMLNRDFASAYNAIGDLKVQKGLALADILKEVHLLVHRIDFPVIVRSNLVEKLSDIEYRLSFGGSEKIQLGALIAAFQLARVKLADFANVDDDDDALLLAAAESAGV